VISRSRDLAVFALLVLASACIACPTTANAEDERGEGEVRIAYSTPTRACSTGNPRRPQRKYWCLALQVTNQTSNAVTLVTDPLSFPPKRLLTFYWFQYRSAEPGSEWESNRNTDGVSILQYTRVDPRETVEVYIHFPGARMPLPPDEAAVRIAFSSVEGETFYSDPFPDNLLKRN
jgi:hypothetical protein